MVFHAILFLTVTLLLSTFTQAAADECPPQDSYLGSCLRAPSIETYDEFKNIVEAASSGDRVCFSNFRVSVNETAEPTTISEDVHIQCESANLCIFEGGDTVIRLNGRKAKAIIQGFTFTKAKQPVTIAKERERGQRQKICNCDFLMNKSSENRGSAIGILGNGNVFVGHCRFRDNLNDKQGGAIYNVGDLTVHKSIFSYNAAKNSGGAIMNKPTATVELLECTFTGNSALDGPAVHVQGGYDSVKQNWGNDAIGNAGCNGIFYEGGLECAEFAASPTIPLTPSNPAPDTPSVGAQCSDYTGLKFYTIGTMRKPCKWLARDLNMRGRQFCSSPEEEGINTLADALCPSTCNKCTSECIDSNAAFKRSKNGGEKKCEYLRDPKRGERRKAKYCSTEPGMNTNADAACPVACNKCQLTSPVIQDKLDPNSPDDSEAPSGAPSTPPTPSPTTSPTASPTDYVPEWQTNPVPDDPEKGYFNYNPNDSRYGPDGWKTIRPDEVRHTLEYKYWKEFEKDMNKNIDLEHNYCGEETYKALGYIQSPIEINDANVEGECHEYHQIRDEPGDYRLDDEAVKMQILPSKLRIKWPRTFDKFACPTAMMSNDDVDVKCPPSADIPKSWGSHLPVLHVDFKMPSEHTLNGKRYAGEYQIWHWQSSGRGAPVVNVLVDVPDVRGDIQMEKEYHNDYFQIAIDEWKKSFVSQNECMARKDPNFDWVDVNSNKGTRSKSRLGSRHGKDPATELEAFANNMEETHDDGRHGKPPSLRGLSHPENTKPDVHFNPYDSSLMPSIWFYGYDRVSLTEPPCTPIASYHVIDTSMKISTKQHRELQHMLFAHVDPDLTDDDCNPTGVHFDGSVARPTQELGVGRELHRCTCKDFYSDKFRRKTGLRDCDDSLYM